MSRVTSHVSQLLLIYIYFLEKMVKLVGGGSVINEVTPSIFPTCNMTVVKSEPL